MKQLLFVYGTLRPGDYNAERAERFEGVTDLIATNVRTRGRMRCAFDDGGYPVVDVYSTKSTIVGDILAIDVNSDRYEFISHMEIGAGYVPVHIVVPMKLQDGSTNGEPQYPGEYFSSSYSCLIWHYPKFDAKRLGAHIPDGDWLAHAR